MTATIRELLERVKRSSLTAPGETTSPLRESVAKVAAAAVGGGTHVSDLDPKLAEFVRAVAMQPELADVDGLVAAGRSDDWIFEVVVVAAVSAGSVRAECGLKALDGEP